MNKLFLFVTLATLGLGHEVSADLVTANGPVIYKSIQENSRADVAPYKDYVIQNPEGVPLFRVNSNTKGTIFQIRSQDGSMIYANISQTEPTKFKITAMKKNEAGKLIGTDLAICEGAAIRKLLRSDTNEQFGTAAGAMGGTLQKKDGTRFVNVASYPGLPNCVGAALWFFRAEMGLPQ